MKSKKIFSLLVLTSMILVLSISCGSTGPSIRDGDVARLRPGMSEGEVTKIIGFKPQSKLSQPDGTTEMTWTIHSSGALQSFGKEESNTISILFGPDGKMIRINKRTSF